MSLIHAATSPEQTYLRSENQWLRKWMAIFKPSVIFSALVNQTITTNDMIDEVTYDTATGTYGDIKTNMTLLIGSSAGASDIGIARIRKAASGTKIYFSPISVVEFANNVHLTVINDFSLWARPVTMVSGALRMDVDNAYIDQHEDFDPVPLLGVDAVAWLTAATVDVLFDAGDSWVFDSSISGYDWSAPGASATSGMTTATPTITYDAAGHYIVYCTVTAANGKTSTGVRRVFIFDSTHRPTPVIVRDPGGDTQTGGWQVDATLNGSDADLSDVRNRAYCVLFSKDYYGGTEVSLGQVENRENNIVAGYIAGETIHWNPEENTFDFIVQGPHWWANRITLNPLSLAFATNTPTEWNQMPALTVNRALWHLLHWRSNFTALHDVRLTDSTLYAPTLESMEGTLWSQLKEIAFDKIFARPCCDRFGRLFVEIDPQCVPVADRTWTTVMDITKKDWMDMVDVTRKNQRELAMLFTSAWLTDSSGATNTLYSLAAGHIHAQHGDVDTIDKLLAGSQADINELTGLYMGWKNHELDFTFNLAQNNRLIDIAPRQFLSVTMDTTDNARGIAYTGNLIPRTVTLRTDPETGTDTTDVFCEAESFAELAVNGDIPAGAGGEAFDPSFEPDFPPADIDIPDMGDLGAGFLYMPASVENNTQPREVVIWTSTHGVLYTKNFHETTPIWYFMNNGIDPLEKNYVQKIVVAPSGAMMLHIWDAFSAITQIYTTSGLGGTWTKMLGTVSGDNITAIGVNPLKNEQFAFCAGTNGNANFYLADRSTYDLKQTGLAISSNVVGSIYFSKNQWVQFCQSTLGGFPPAILVVYTKDGVYSTYYTIYADTPFLSGVCQAGLGIGTTLFYWNQYPPSATAFATSTGAGRTQTQYTVAGGFPKIESYYGLAVSPTAQKLMGMNSAGTIIFSSDGGATWSTSGSIPTNLDVWENCNDDFRFIAGGGVSLKLLMNFSDYTAGHNKEGNLLYVAPLCDIIGIRFIK